MHGYVEAALAYEPDSKVKMLNALVGLKGRLVATETTETPSSPRQLPSQALSCRDLVGTDASIPVLQVL